MVELSQLRETVQQQTQVLQDCVQHLHLQADVIKFLAAEVQLLKDRIAKVEQRCCDDGK